MERRRARSRPHHPFRDPSSRRRSPASRL